MGRLAGWANHAERTLAKDSPTGFGFLRLDLQARQPEALERFYRDLFGLPVTRGADRSITLHAGGTELRFSAVPAGEPYYHFAFNIPENQLDAALDWVRARVPIIPREDGSEVHDFASWNAHAFYFLDPAGNIVEFIARHNLPNAACGSFGPQSILYVSEIGIVLPDVSAGVAVARREFGLAPFAGSCSDEFAAMGDDHRLLILVHTGRPWHSDGRPSEIFPTGVILRGERSAEWTPDAGPYRIVMQR